MRRVLIVFGVLLAILPVAAQDALPAPEPRAGFRFVLPVGTIAGDPLTVILIDKDATAEEIVVTAVTYPSDPESVTLTRTQPGQYEGTVVVSNGPQVASNGIIEVSPGEAVGFDYGGVASSTEFWSLVQHHRLLANTSFETHANEPSLEGWVKTEPDDKVVCNKPGKTVPVRHGQCAFRFAGGGAVGKLRFEVVANPDYLASIGNHQPYFSFDIPFRAQAGRQLRVKLKVNGPTSSVSDTYTVHANSDFIWTRWPGGYINGGVPLSWGSDVQSIVVTLIDKNSGGKMYIDGVEAMLGMTPWTVE